MTPTLDGMAVIALLLIVVLLCWLVVVAWLSGQVKGRRQGLAEAAAVAIVVRHELLASACAGTDAFYKRGELFSQAEGARLVADRIERIDDPQPDRELVPLAPARNVPVEA